MNVMTMHRLYLQCVVAGLVLCGEVHAQIDIPILTKPIPVTASYATDKVTTAGECRSFEPTYRIADRGRILSAKPGFIRACQEPIDVALRRAVNVYGSFITIRGNCGGNAWNCEERVLFTFTGEDIVRLGRIDDYLFALGRTLFLKHFDWYEVNDFTGHSRKVIRVVLGVYDRRLVIDPELTWIFNHDRIESSKWQPSRDGCGRNQEASSQVECYEQLIYTLQLAKLTGRTSLYNDAIALAQRNLDSASFAKIRKMAEAITPASVQKWLDADRE